MQILDTEIPFKKNLKTSFRLYWYLWIILVATAFSDFVTTVSFMHEGGVQLEGNVIVRWLASTLGILPGVFIGKSLQILAAIGFSALSLKFSRAILLLILLLNLAAVMINLL